MMELLVVLLFAPLVLSSRLPSISLGHFSPFPTSLPCPLLSVAFPSLAFPSLAFPSPCLLLSLSFSSFLPSPLSCPLSLSSLLPSLLSLSLSSLSCPLFSLLPSLLSLAPSSLSCPLLSILPSHLSCLTSLLHLLSSFASLSLASSLLPSPLYLALSSLLPRLSPASPLLFCLSLSCLSSPFWHSPIFFPLLSLALSSLLPSPLSCLLLSLAYSSLLPTPLSYRLLFLAFSPLFLSPLSSLPLSHVFCLLSLLLSCSLFVCCFLSLTISLLKGIRHHCKDIFENVICIYQQLAPGNYQCLIAGTTVSHSIMHIPIIVATEKTRYLVLPRVCLPWSLPPEGSLSSSRLWHLMSPQDRSSLLFQISQLTYSRSWATSP